MEHPLEPADATLADVTMAVTPADAAYGEPVAVRRRKTPIVLGAAVAVALVVSVGAFVAYRLVFGGPQAVERMPASVVAAVSLDLTPGLDQGRKLAKLSEKMPQTGKEKDPHAALIKALKSLGLDDIDIERDVAGWLGTRLAAGAWANSEHEPYGLLVLQSTDDKAATAGLNRIKDGAKSPLAFTVHDGFALVAFAGKHAQEAVEAAEAEAKTSPLSKSAKYADARKWLEGDQFAVFYADYDAIGKIAQSMLPSEMAGGSFQTSSGTMIVGVRAEDDGFTARFRSFGGKAKAASTPADAADAVAKVAALPSNTALGVAIELPADFDLGPLAAMLPLGLTGPTPPDTALTPREQKEFDGLMQKQMTGKLTKAEEKRFGELSEKMFAGSFGGKALTPAEQKELETLLGKANPTDAERKRIAELLGAGPNLGAPNKAWENLLSGLGGAVITVSATDILSAPAFRAVIELAKQPDAEVAKELAGLSSEAFTVKVDGRTVSLQTPGFTASGRLADDPLFQRASAGAPNNAQTAAYVDLTHVLPAKLSAKIGPFQAIFLSGGGESGMVRVLIG